MSSYQMFMSEMANRISPIQLFNMDQARKLGAEAAPMMPGRGAAWKTAREAFASRPGTTMGRYLSGEYLNEAPRVAGVMDEMYRGIAERSMARKWGVGIAAAGLLGPTILGRDNPITGLGLSALKVGGAAAASWGLWEIGARGGGMIPKAGAVGLAGMTLLNILRPNKRAGS